MKGLKPIEHDEVTVVQYSVRTILEGSIQSREDFDQKGKSIFPLPNCLIGGKSSFYNGSRDTKKVFLSEVQKGFPFLVVYRRF